MPQAKPNPIVHVLPSLTDFAFLMPVIFMFSKMDGAKSLLLDGDTGWHIRTGEWILANGRIPRNDIFSFTKPGQPWFAWEWLSDVLLGWLHQHWGLAGVVLLGMLVLCTTSALLFRLVSRRCSNPLIAIGFTFLAVVTSTCHWHARPHMFTFLFTVIFLHMLDRVRGGRTSLLWILPPLTLLWTNLHGGFFVGIFLVGCYAAGELATYLVERERAMAALVRMRVYLAAATGCLLASLVNPYGYKLHFFIFSYLQQPFLDRIDEFMAPNFRHAGAVTFELLLFFGIAVAAWSLVRRRFADAFIIIAWTHFALMAVRNLPIFAFVCAPVAAGSIQEALALLGKADVSDWIRRRSRALAGLGGEFAELDRLWRVHAVSALVAVALAAAVLHARPGSKFAAEFDPTIFPVKPVEALTQRARFPRIFTKDQWGDYILYRFYPSARVFMDGRSDFYGNDFVNQYSNLLNVGYGWQAQLSRYDVDVVLMPLDSPLAPVLKESAKWRAIYDDHKTAIMFERSDRRSEGEQVSAGNQPEEGRDQRVAAVSSRARKVTANNNRDLRITKHKSI